MTAAFALPSTSLDTPLTEGAVVSGYSFREVAPEILSPLSWSVVGAGSERGLRMFAQRMGVTVAASQPEFTAFVGFRAFHRVDSIERIVERVPGLDRSDCWEFLFGGPPPVGLGAFQRATTWQRLWSLPREFAILQRSRDWAGDAACAVHAAEQQTNAGMAAGTAWGLGSATAASVSAGRQAWALHAATTCSVVVAAGMLRRALVHQLGEDSAQDVFRMVVRRQVASPCVLPGLGDTSGGHRIWNYEVADATDRFAAWTSRCLDDGVLSRESETSGNDADRVLPRGLATYGILIRLVDFVGVLVSEREASTVLGLRALHCLRRLLDAGALGQDREAAAMLAPHELRTLDATTQKGLASDRASELADVANVGVPVDFLIRDGQPRPLRRRMTTLSGHAVGVPMAPGWAEGVLVDSPRGDGDDVLVGQRVDAHDVLAGAPTAVVSQMGSMLSYVAIVCRELGIPLVTGVSVAGIAAGARVQVDGWTGRVTVVSAKGNNGGEGNRR